jgi:hypothetical protein
MTAQATVFTAGVNTSDDLQIQAVGDRGVSVPPGLDGREIVAAAREIVSRHRIYEIDYYAACSIAVTVLKCAHAMRQSESSCSSEPYRRPE